MIYNVIILSIALIATTCSCMRSPHEYLSTSQEMFFKKEAVNFIVSKIAQLEIKSPNGVAKFVEEVCQASSAKIFQNEREKVTEQELRVIANYPESDIRHLWETSEILRDLASGTGNGVACTLQGLELYINAVKLVNPNLKSFFAGEHHGSEFSEFMYTFGGRRFVDCGTTLESMMKAREPDSRLESEWDDMIAAGQGSKHTTGDTALAALAEKYDFANTKFQGKKMLSALKNHTPELGNKSRSYQMLTYYLTSSCPKIEAAMRSIYLIYNLARGIKGMDANGQTYSPKFYKLMEYCRLCSQLSLTATRDAVLENIKKSTSLTGI